MKEDESEFRLRKIRDRYAGPTRDHKGRVVLIDFEKTQNDIYFLLDLIKKMGRRK